MSLSECFFGKGQGTMNGPSDIPGTTKIFPTRAVNEVGNLSLIPLIISQTNRYVLF